MNKENTMTEEEFQNQLMDWAKSGVFDRPHPSLKLMAGFDWILHAEDNYCKMSSFGNYNFCGLDFKITPSSKVNGVEVWSGN